MAIMLNDLYDYGLKIYQDKDNFKFSLDSLLLSEFVQVQKNDQNLLDLCSGNAPLPMIIASIYPQLKITGVELQTPIYNQALKSLKYNNLDNQITMLNINALDINNYFPGNNFDIITCNPPFFKVNESSLINPDETKALARHEIAITLEDIFQISSDMLKDNGKLFMVHRPERLEEIINLANNYKFHLKKIIFIHSNPNEKAIMVLIKFVKNSEFGVKVYSKIVNRDIKTYKNIFKGCE